MLCNNVLRSGSGTEYTNKGVAYTAPYNPQQNGSAERENRELVELARSMLFGKNCLKYYMQKR